MSYFGLNKEYRKSVSLNVSWTQDKNLQTMKNTKIRRSMLLIKLNQNEAQIKDQEKWVGQRVINEVF